MAGWAQEYCIRDCGDIHNARLGVIGLDGWRLVEGVTVAGDVGLNPRDDLHVEVPRVLFLGLCLNFHYFSTGVVFPKLGFDFSRRAVAQALVEP